MVLTSSKNGSIKRTNTSMQETLIVALLVGVTIIIGLLGYMIGKLSNNYPSNSQSFLQRNSTDSKREGFSGVTIDEKKVVTNINTSGLEKKYDTLGDTKNSDENISTSVNKLKTLKG